MYMLLRPLYLKEIEGARDRPPSAGTPPSARAPPLSSEQGTHKAVQTRFHVQTLIIHKLGSTKFTPQNDLDW